MSDEFASMGQLESSGWEGSVEIRAEYVQPQATHTVKIFKFYNYMTPLINNKLSDQT